MDKSTLQRIAVGLAAAISIMTNYFLSHIPATVNWVMAEESASAFQAILSYGLEGLLLLCWCKMFANKDKLPPGLLEQLQDRVSTIEAKTASQPEKAQS